MGNDTFSALGSNWVYSITLYQCTEAGAESMDVITVVFPALARKGGGAFGCGP